MNDGQVNILGASYTIIDWFALQGPKIMTAWQDAHAL